MHTSLRLPFRTSDTSSSMVLEERRAQSSIPTKYPALWYGVLSSKGDSKETSARSRKEDTHSALRLAAGKSESFRVLDRRCRFQSVSPHIVHLTDQ